MRYLRALPFLLALLLLTATAAQAAPTGGAGGPLTDRRDVPFSAGGLSSRTHIYAGGLDWTRPVGLLVYGDGTGDYGYLHPDSSYLMAGGAGLAAVAKKHNMVLVVPLPPGGDCDNVTSRPGTCWYQASGAVTVAQKVDWLKALIDSVKRTYPLETTRTVLAGYSSGAQLVTEYLLPRYGAAIMPDGLALAISYGGAPQVATTFTAAFKAAVPVVWDVGSLDPSYTGTSDQQVKAGRAWYRNHGFVTELNVVQGLGHSRSDFGAIVDREVTQHVP